MTPKKMYSVGMKENVDKRKVIDAKWRSETRVPIEATLTLNETSSKNFDFTFSFHPQDDLAKQKIAFCISTPEQLIFLMQATQRAIQTLGFMVRAHNGEPIEEDE